MDRTSNPALAALRYYVTGAIERGEATPIVEIPAPHCWRMHMVARGLRTRRDNSPAFRRADLARRATARRKRFERIGEAWFACGSVERAAVAYASALNCTRRAARLMGVAR